MPRSDPCTHEPRISDTKFKHKKREKIKKKYRKKGKNTRKMNEDKDLRRNLKSGQFTI